MFIAMKADKQAKERPWTNTRTLQELRHTLKQCLNRTRMSEGWKRGHELTKEHVVNMPPDFRDGVSQSWHLTYASDFVIIQNSITTGVSLY